MKSLRLLISIIFTIVVTNVSAADVTLEMLNKLGKETMSKEDKIAVLQQINSANLCRAVATLVTLHLVALTHRIEINVLARSINEGGSDDWSVNYAFLSSTRYIMDGAGVDVIADVTRSVVDSCLANDQLGPSSWNNLN